MSNVEELYQIDRQFCQDCQTGKEVAWASYFASDGVMVTTADKDNIVGNKAIEAAMKPLFSLPDLTFTWEPEYAEISKDGSLGVTRGRSFMRYKKDGELFERKGQYTTVWRYMNGSWKIIWDIGN